MTLMSFILRWLMPAVLVLVGIAVLTGFLLPDNTPTRTLLRPMLGLIVVIVGINRFVAARMTSPTSRRRRFGGERQRPWEDKPPDDKPGAGNMSSLLLIALSASLLIFGCKPRAPEESMTAGHAVIGASDAVFKLAWKLSAAFQTGNPAAFVDIVRNQNLALVDSLLNERTEEVFLDRTLLPAETLAIRQAGLKLFTYPVAFYPVFLMVARDNPVESIDSLGLHRILTGESRNWRQIGGDDRALTLYTPLPGEGAFQSLVDYFGRLDSVTAEPCSTAEAMLILAAGDGGALLIWSLPIEGLPFKRLSFQRGGMLIPPNVETIMEEPRYPFRLNITYVTTHNKADVAAGYLTFSVGNTGQREVTRLGYRPAAVPVRIVRLRS